MPAFAQDLDLIPPVNADTEALIRALNLEKRASSSPKLSISGVSVPHHLLAADLIARGLWAAAGNTYDRIIILTPDHFRRSQLAAATTPRGFRTAFGPVFSDPTAVEELLSHPYLFEDSALFEHEHGITAILPFVRFIFPGVPIVPVALNVATTSGQWEQIVEAIRPIVTERTLIVQSTDFSHYLLPRIARMRDQQTLNVLATRDTGLLSILKQSDHLDSKAAQYVQTRLQEMIFHSHVAVVANRNSFEYLGRNEPSTSYIVMVYARDAAELSTLQYPDQHVLFFGGDVFPSRWLTVPLSNSSVRDEILQGLTHYTGGQPVVVNLEGVLISPVPIGVPAVRHVMDENLVGPMLKDINIVAAGLANNHSFDMGYEGFSESQKNLRSLGIRAIPHGHFVDVGPLRVLALNFIGSGDTRGYPVTRPVQREMDRLSEHLCRQQVTPPIIALTHWGIEYTSSGGALERHIAERLAGCGISVTLGAHSHQASRAPELVAGGDAIMFYSMGNLLFDQSSAKGSGALIEVRIFSQKTLAIRKIDLPNFYDMAVRH
jgi:AmmeMemoRadiSam system protein B